MKEDWNDYMPTTPLPDKHAYREMRVQQIKNERMTEQERHDAMIALKTEVHEWYQKAVRPRREEEARLDNEFYADCRAEFGYDSWLTEEGCKELESYAYSEGHSSGHSGVYGELCDLVPMVERLVRNLKQVTEDSK